MPYFTGLFLDIKATKNKKGVRWKPLLKFITSMVTPWIILDFNRFYSHIGSQRKSSSWTHQFHLHTTDAQSDLHDQGHTTKFCVKENWQCSKIKGVFHVSFSNPWNRSHSSYPVSTLQAQVIVFNRPHTKRIENVQARWKLELQDRDESGVQDNSR
jgi:hypothetical protein